MQTDESLRGISSKKTIMQYYESSPPTVNKLFDQRGRGRNQHQTRNVPTGNRTDPQQNTKRACWRCSGRHPHYTCRFTNAVCNACRIKCHLQAECVSHVHTPQSSSSRNGGATHHVADTAEQPVCHADTDGDTEYEECYDTTLSSQHESTPLPSMSQWTVNRSP